MKIIIQCTGGKLDGRIWRFSGQGQIHLGRASDNNIVTHPEDMTISRRHCVIEVVPPNIFVSDQGSSHGTYVNGQRIAPGQRILLRDGEEIYVGNGAQAECFRISVVEEAGQPTPSRPQRQSASQEQSAYDAPYREKRAHAGRARRQAASGAETLGGFSGAFQMLTAKIKDIFVSPVRTALYFAETDNVFCGVLMNGLLLALLLLALIIAMLVINAKIEDSIGYFSSYIQIPWGRIILLSLVSAAIYLFGLPAFCYLSAGIFFRAKVTYAKFLNVLGVCSVWNIVYWALGFLLMAFGSGGMTIASLLFLFAMVHTSAIFLFSYAELVKLSPDRKMYAWLIGTLLFVMAYAIYISVLGQSLISSISDLLSL